MDVNGNESLNLNLSNTSLSTSITATVTNTVKNSNDNATNLSNNNLIANPANLIALTNSTNSLTLDALQTPSKTDNNMNKFSVQNSTNHNTSTNNIDKRKSHNCPYCDRSFTRPYRLNDHISFSHTDEVCIFSFEHKPFGAIYLKNCFYLNRGSICASCAQSISHVKIN